METQWEPLPDLRDVSDSPVDAALAGPLELRVRAMHYIDQAVVDERWTDDSPVESSGVDLGIRDAQADSRTVICPSIGGHESLRGGGYLVMYHPGVSAETVFENPAHPRPERARRRGPAAHRARQGSLAATAGPARGGGRTVAADRAGQGPGRGAFQPAAFADSLAIHGPRDGVVLGPPRARRRAKLRPARAGG